MTFDERVELHFAAMSPAEQRVIQFFRQNREEVMIASAASMGRKTKTSDATIVRAARRLGYSGLDALRRSLAEEMRQNLSPADRLKRTLDEVGNNPTTAFQATIDTHLQCLQSLSRSILPGQFESVVDALATARRVVAFGIGPSSAMVDYLATQLGRFGIEALSLTTTGLLFADDLRKLRDGDVVMIFAYGRVYAELAALLDSAKALDLRVFLVTDSLASALKKRVEMILSVPRGRSDMLSMHTATLGFIEALLVGIATKRPGETVASLKKLNQTRTRLAGKTVELHAAG
ncbi:MAG TPA: MurR/RpiR family transcriptional regulator [Stellaceae bacterium]|jgi:DNA-binding MurR/RpiR family transcriptional regulator|nr:MurR/RpiR family transcriptional regulator [Stellaceae bacterium]